MSSQNVAPVSNNTSSNYITFYDHAAHTGSVTNYASLTATGTYPATSPGSATGISVLEHGTTLIGNIINIGRIVSSNAGVNIGEGRTAVTTESNAGAVLNGSLTNSGTITSQVGVWIGGNSTQLSTVTGSIINTRSGQINYTNVGINAGFATVGGSITNYGTITGAGTAGINFTFGNLGSTGTAGSGNIVNATFASIASNYIGIIVNGNAAGATATIAGSIINEGTITVPNQATHAGIEIAAATALGGISNTGTINGGVGIELFGISNKIASVAGNIVNGTGGQINAVSTNSTSGGIEIYGFEGGGPAIVGGSIVNAGRISATGGTSTNVGILLQGVNLAGGITNSSTISVSGGNINVGISVAKSSGANFAPPSSSIAGGIVNQGTITAGTGILVSGGSTVTGGITNSGNLTGIHAAIDLTGEGSATMISQTAGTITGAIKLSANADILTVTGGAIAGNIVGEGSSDTVDFALGAGNTFSYSNTISGVNAVNANTGTVLLKGTVNSSNLAIAVAGTLLVGTGGNVVPSVTDNGVFGFEQSGTYTYAGAISGSGVVEQIGTGTTVLTAAEDSGNTSISSGTLDIGSGGSVSGNVQFSGNEATLELATSPSQIGGDIVGTVKGDNIDLGYVSFATGDHMVWQQNGATGTLSLVTGGGSTLTTLNLAGQYTSSDFTAMGDGNNGTLIELAFSVWTKIDNGPPAAMAGGDFEGTGTAQLVAAELGYGTYLWLNGIGWKKIDTNIYSGMVAADFYGTSRGNANNADLVAWSYPSGIYTWQSGFGWTEISNAQVVGTDAAASGNFHGAGVELVESQAGMGNINSGTYTWSPSTGWVRIDGGIYYTMAAGDFYGTSNNNYNNTDLAVVSINNPNNEGVFVWGGGNWVKIDNGVPSYLATGNFLGTSNGNNNQIDLAASYGDLTYIWSANYGWMKLPVVNTNPGAGLAAIQTTGNGQSQLLEYFLGNAGMFEWQNGVGWTTYDNTSALPNPPQTNATFATGNFLGGTNVVAATGFYGTNGVWVDPPAASSAAPITVADGATTDIAAPSAAAVTFAGTGGTLQLGQSASFSGTIAGFAGQDQLDLTDIGYAANTTLGYATNASGSGGALTVSNGVNTANIALLGSYMASSFVTSSDSTGGTLVSEAAQMSAQATPLAQPRAAL
jgi:hypothetical protein